MGRCGPLPRPRPGLGPGALSATQLRRVSASCGGLPNAAGKNRGPRVPGPVAIRNHAYAPIGTKGTRREVHRGGCWGARSGTGVRRHGQCRTAALLVSCRLKEHKPPGCVTPTGPTALARLGPGGVDGGQGTSSRGSGTLGVVTPSAEKAHRITKIALGPIRIRRIIQPLWLGFLLVIATRHVSIAVVVVATASLLLAVRAAQTRVELRDDSIVVVNVLRHRRLPLRSIERSGFAKRLAGWPVPLVLSGPDLWIRATGVSVSSRGFRWPDQPFVKRGRNVERVERFFQTAGIPFDDDEPLDRHALDG